MNRVRPTVVLLALLPPALGHGAIPSLDTPAQAPVENVLAAEIKKNFGKLPLAFEENRGQIDPSYDFISRGPNYKVLVSRSEAVIRLSTPTRDGEKSSVQSTIRMRFVNAKKGEHGKGAGALSGKVNYFIGSDPSKHLTDIPSYAKVSYDDIYPGTDLVYYGNQRQLEYDLVVAPGADPKQVRMAFDADSVTIDKEGNLVLRAGKKDVQLRRPALYQDIDGKQKTVAGHYVKLGKKEVGFQVAAYDATKPLVIDPVLSYSTYLGGGSYDYGLAIAADADGHAYVAGSTRSGDFPILGAYDARIGRTDTDVFVTKFNLDGSGLVYSTYLGGANSIDYPEGIVLDSAGNAFIAGNTSGTDYPTTVGAYQTGVAGGGFVTKLNASGNTLGYSTYLLNATTRDIAIDSAGNAYLTGDAASTFATTPNAYQPTANAGDAFVAKLNTTGSALVYATFLGGSGTEIGYAVAVGPDDSAYVAGSTTSTDFPTVNPFQSTLRSVGEYNRDGFVTKVDPSGGSLAYSTYLGGNMTDVAYAIKVDAAGNAYVGGETYSTDFPIKNAFRPTKPGTNVSNGVQGVGFITKLMPFGNSVHYSTFLGGEICASPCYYYIYGEKKGDAVYSLAIDDAGHAYVTGIARSYTFPLINSFLPAKTQDNYDSLYAAKIGITGKSILYSTLLRTNFNETGTIYDLPYGAGRGIAVDAAAAAYVTSENDYWTTTQEYMTTPGAFQTTPLPGRDAVVSKIAAASSLITLASSTNPSTSSAPVTLTATLSDPTLTGTVIFLREATQIGSATISNGTAVLTTSALGAGVHRISAIYRSNTATADSGLLYQIVNHALVCN